MSLRRIVHAFERSLYMPVQPLLWTPKQDGDRSRTFCDKCAVHYPRPTCFYDQEAGESATGPRCEECDHVVRYEEIVEEGKTYCKVLVRCHGAEELHVHDLGSVEWKENAYDPEDRYEQLREQRMTARYFVPTEHAEPGADVSGVGA